MQSRTIVAAVLLSVAASVGWGQSAILMANVSGGAPTCTPATGYLHCRQLTIDHTQAGGTTLTNFPVLVSATLGSLRLQNSNCYDHVYRSDSAGVTSIPYDQDSITVAGCNTATGAVIDWVLVPSVSASVDTVFYVSYDNASISTPQSNPSAVWAAYLAVYHLGTSSTLSLADSTANGATLTNGSPPAPPGTGNINGAVAFGASTGETLTDVGGVTSIPANSDFTMSWWQLIPSGATQFRLSCTSAITVYNPYTDNAIYYGNGVQISSTDYSANYGVWAYVVVTSRADGTAENIYVNGAQVASAANAPFSSGSCSVFQFSAAIPGWSMDELRIATSPETVGQSLAEYNNQKSGSTFLRVGGEI